MTTTRPTTASARRGWTPVVVMLLTAAIASPTWAGPVRAASPLNDAFADAAVLSGPLPLAVTGSNVDATSEAGEPWHGTDAAASVWWSWTAPANGTLHVSACGSDFDTLLAVYTGTTLATLTQVAQNDDACDFQSEVLVRVDAGTTYAIAVDGFGGATGAIALALDLFAAPANDDFADARVLTGPLPITTTGSTEHASREAGEPEHGAPGYLGSASVWLSWTPAESGVVTIDLCDGSDFLTLLSVYVGDSLGALTQLGGNLYGCGPFSRLTLSAVAGTAYRIAIDGGFGDTGNYSLDIRPALALNDNFADATVLSGPLPIVAHGTNAGATNENGEPNGADPNPTETRWGPDSSVWYRWTAAATGPVSIETCGSEMDSVLAVYEGATLTGLTRVGWNSNACSVQSLLWVDAVAGHTYQIAVGTVAFEGAITLTIRVAGPPPANDGFADARRLPSALPILVNDSNYEATSQPGEPAHAGLTAAASVWYRWTPSRSQLVNIDTCASDSFKFLAVYSGDRLGALTEVAANHGPASYLCAGYGGVLRFPVIARTTYWIAVDGDRGSIALSLRPAVPPANDAFSAPVTLAGPLPLSTTATTTDATYEPSEPVDYTGQGRGASVWWSWTPSVSQVVAIETCEVGPASTMYSLVGVWTGSSVDALEQAPDQVINHCRYGTSITLPVEAGQTYRVSVDSFYYGVLAGRLGLPMDMEGTVPLTIRAVHPPTNDAFDARQVLTGPLPITITAANDDATAEPAEPGHDFLSNFDVPMRSVWYEWTATSTGRVIIESCDNPTDVVVGLYEGVGLGELTDLEGFELQTCPAGSRHPLDVVAGSTYLIAIDGGEGDQGPFTLTIRDADPPANDLMADAQVLTGALPIVAAGTTVDATVEPGEPDHSTGTRNGYETPTHSIWYSWTPDADEHVAIDTCPTDAFTRLVVFAGADPMTATEVGAGDFVCALESTVSLAAVGGTTYWIKVDGRDTGPISLRIRRHSPPVNDAFTGASDLGRRSQASVTTSRLDATAEPGEPRHGGLGAGQSVWFRWTAPSGGIVTIDTCGSDIHTMLGVYTGAAVDALTTIASGGDMACGLRGGSRLTFPVTARTTYRIAVDWAKSLIDLPFNPGGMVSLHLQLEAGSGAAGSRTAPGGLPA